jgi:hypothetical protein
MARMDRSEIRGGILAEKLYINIAAVTWIPLGSIQATAAA